MGSNPTASANCSYSTPNLTYGKIMIGRCVGTQRTDGIKPTKTIKRGFSVMVARLTRYTGRFYLIHVVLRRFVLLHSLHKRLVCGSNPRVPTQIYGEVAQRKSTYR